MLCGILYKLGLEHILFISVHTSWLNIENGGRNVEVTRTLLVV